MLSLIVAKSRNDVIGRDGRLPWHLPTDLRRFKELTTGHTVVMGRKTFDSLPPKVRPLPNRHNIVLSRDASYAPAAGVTVEASLEAAIEAAPRDRDCFVIGGAEAYATALAIADRLYITEVDSDVDGDVHFPPVPEDEWECVEESAPIVEDEHEYRFRTYERRR